ncbi:MAG: hypothetical protein ACOCSE_00965, partial [Chitinivibrionales bacterium]
MNRGITWKNPFFSLMFLLVFLSTSVNVFGQPRPMEDLNRGLVALEQQGGGVYLSWRMLGTEPMDIGFN